MDDNDDYDPTADFARSIDECYRAIRQRVLAGGPGWGGWPTDVRALAGGQARQRSDSFSSLAAQDRAAPVPSPLHRRARGAILKWYPHDPSAALAGMIGLTVEERGAYYTLMDLQYARAPHGDVTDELVIKALAVRPQVWRRLKASLIAKGKVHETEGKLAANRVAAELTLAANRGANSGQTPPQTPRKLGANPPDNEVVSDTTSAKNNELDGLRARATTTTTSILESSNGKGREEPKEKVVLPPVVNYRDPGVDYRSPPRTKSDNVLDPLPDKIAAKHKDES